MKTIKAIVKLQIPAGKANPAPPVGPTLGQHGLNIIEFCQKFNEATKEKGSDLIPVEITIFGDRTFEFKLKTPPVTFLLKKAAGIKKGSGEPSKNKVGKVTIKQVDEIAKIKMKDLNTNDIKKVRKIIEGIAKSMGIIIEG
ncbi:MAG: 50S ribosomal protein L11 [Parcubacteria group bacterium CG_4_9_14_0_2_um_filter_35_11]|nr:MAG: 50S ribosomal protein L11 [Parcubacteria group bacterium CG07_land_8_20_14_0_80_35_11]PJC47355.1 MAG: 50S ribosomal protein L11 [Parcubacteria group bacterium CG_4_9_14_0_2_um_filter_35_11]